jgi:mono/diheme cytochrome c family protein
MKQSKHARKRSKPGATRNLVIGAVFVAMVALVVFNLMGNRSRTTSADPTDVKLVARGQVVYQSHCASCHGANLEGQPDWQQPRPDGTWPAPPHDPSGHTWHHSDESLFATTKFGGQATAPVGYKSTMPAFGAVLSDDDIWAVLAYIKSTWPPEVLAAQQAGHQ